MATYFPRARAIVAFIAPEMPRLTGDTSSFKRGSL